MATISSVCTRSGVLGSAEALGQAHIITIGSCLPAEAPGQAHTIAGGGPGCDHRGVLFESDGRLAKILHEYDWWGDSQLDPSQARA
jgi:hypothetical protein